MSEKCINYPCQLPKGHAGHCATESQPQQDAPIPLPKELANWHEDLCGERNGTEIRSRIVAEDVIPLIERIGRAEAALTRAREALEYLDKNCTAASYSPWAEAKRLARSALAATQPRET